MGVNLDVFVRALAYATFVLALLTNALLILLALKKTSRDFGAYKYIMLCFGLFNILYSLTELLTQPAILLVESSYMVYSDSYLSRYGWLCYLLLSIFMGMYGLSTILLAMHFFYRYILICKVEWIILWIVIMLGWGSIYGLIAYYAYAPSEAFYEFARHEVLTQLDRNIDYLTFFCVFPYERIDGVTKVHWRYCLGLFCCIMMMIITVIVIVYCGVQTIRMLRKACMSPKTLFLHKQLLKALFAQAVLPFAFSYTPRFIMFFFTLMGIAGHSFYTFVPSAITFYAFLDPLTNIYFNPDFKRTTVTLLRRYFCCHRDEARLHPQPTSNTVKY
ncbi:hypothetical protein Y032_0479g2218 [Ancylostoma ceylanicum]|uniref:G-protein coupled receptors family 1 profile domain-containing protein n=1 Tax=Ancylostoma ceylanicum TaxID=53326 RepID=A0A016WW60_9BILA|nr:hypothetical protein Y032_0479g2218 [Ancylostoma ceylanicum]